MPTSDVFQIPAILCCAQVIKPKSVLDVGIGFGKYGFLFREYIDLPGASGTFDGTPFGMRLDGIEACESYVTDLQRRIYDKITVGCASAVCRQIPDKEYDCCLLIDVLEHLNPEDGARLLSDVRRISHTAILSTPKHFYAQEGLGDGYERHLSLWSRATLARAHFDVFWPMTKSLVALYVESEQVKARLRKMIGRQRLKSLIPAPAYDLYWRLRYAQPPPEDARASP